MNTGIRYFTELPINQEEGSVDVRLEKYDELRSFCYLAYWWIYSRLYRYNLYRYKLPVLYFFKVVVAIYIISFAK